MKNFVKKYKSVVIALFFISLFVLCCWSVIYKCSHNEKYINYGNNDYIFAIITVGSGRSEAFYAGTISKSDYIKWINGENGTIFIYSTTKENRGYRLNILSITNIADYGNEPKWLPMNFW